MKAVIWTEYGPPDGLQLKEIEKPTPKENEILIKIHASSVTAGDCEMRRLELPLMLSFPVRLYAGLRRPKRITVPWQELAGEVVEAGRNVTLYEVGDQVFGTTGFRFGAYAEYICLPEKPADAQGTLAIKPTNLTYEEAATIPTAGFEALHFLRKANIQAGKKVMIVGAGGSIGTFSIQLAKHLGAEVAGVDSPEKLELIRSLDADRVIDFTKGDYTGAAATYDLIIDVVGTGSVVRRLRLLKDEGCYFLAYAGLSEILPAAWIALASDGKLKIESSSQKKEDLIFLKELIEAEAVKPVIDRRYPLEDASDAHRYVESGNKQGNVVLAAS